MVQGKICEGQQINQVHQPQSGEEEREGQVMSEGMERMEGVMTGKTLDIHMKQLWSHGINH